MGAQGAQDLDDDDDDEEEEGGGGAGDDDELALMGLQVSFWA
jgi:hypothetical protein